MQSAPTRSWIMLSPWIVIGTVILLVPIVIYFAFHSIQTQKVYMEKLLIEKGAALIRSFEAGARTGVLGMSWGGLQIQKLLVETAHQPDIVYLLITDLQGRILAHNDPSMIGQYHGNDLNIKEIARSKSLYYREIPHEKGPDTFEITRYFAPTPGFMTTPFGTAIPDDWFRSRLHPRGEDAPPSRLVIFVGLDMDTIEKARLTDARDTVITAVILLLIGITGVISLLVAQGYRQARVSLSRVKAFSDNLVENMPMALIATDSHGVITSFNQVAESILQVQSKEMKGKSGVQVLPPPFVDFLNELRNDTSLREGEIIVTGEDKKSLPLDMVATTLMENDTFQGHVLLFRDLTEVKRLRKEVDRSQRMASLGRLAAGVAHEIRNPLSSIKGFATYFKERYRDIPDDQKIADIMIQEVERLNRVIGQLLDFARPMKLDKKPASLAQLIDHSVKMIEKRAQNQGVVISYALPDDDMMILVDADRINQVLLNLYLNALESMEGGGSLSIRVDFDESQRLVFAVSDTGGGIDGGNIAKIFDPYFTTKSSGTGLGLAIVHQIIEHHDGAIHVESTPGKGTTVVFTLPVLTKCGSEERQS